MWSLVKVNGASQFWFSDGKPVDTARGNNGESYRLIIKDEGFLDFTEIVPSQVIDANGSRLAIPSTPGGTDPLKRNEDNLPPVALSLRVIGDGGFTLTAGQDSSAPSVTGRLKPFPFISSTDAAFIDNMIASKYIPYQNIPDAPGKTIEEIKALGLQYFPFTNYNFQLAMCVYDWTTASFARLVFMKIFEYTDIPLSPFPIDQNSIASEIWTSSYNTYKPDNLDYMNSFMMKPSNSLDDVKAQLSRVASDLHNWSDVENRLLSTAMESLPRTSVLQHPILYSGQVDIYQLGLDHFGIEFLECPLNSGPVGEELVTAFAEVMGTYVAIGKTITTKMVWSFTDNVNDAMHYSNGILLVAKAPGGSFVWDRAAYVTDLSDDPKKTEYPFMLGTRFEVQLVENITFNDKPIVKITLQPEPSKQALDIPELSSRVVKPLLPKIGESQTLSLVRSDASPEDLPHTPGKTAGRRCACVTGGLA
ncbi:hypothetical protein F5B20DRAFT_596406 [Whalleya microplaca]|nr:hypothetical protein F5B20DRAFT_596406 [Whalleya microplaca]